MRLTQFQPKKNIEKRKETLQRDSSFFVIDLFVVNLYQHWFIKKGKKIKNRETER